MSEYRNEYKYIIDAKEDALLSAIASGIMERDAHSDDNGKYIIRSLYFDNDSNKCYYENENGTDPRWKYRIRYYDDNTEYISLEKKSKQRGMTNKIACRLSRDEAQLLAMGNINDVLEQNMQNAKTPHNTQHIGAIGGDLYSQKIYMLQELINNGMKPKIIVTYEREPFIHPAGNVRVTFDRAISSSKDIERFLDGDYLNRPIMDMGRSILEVKWDEIMPFYIKDSLSIQKLTWTAFSKFYMASKYHC